MSEFFDTNYTEAGENDVKDQVTGEFTQDLAEYEEQKDIKQSNIKFYQCCVLPIGGISLVMLSCYGLWWLSRQ